MFFAGGHFSPDAGGAGEFGQPCAEGFDGEPAVVADLFEGRHGFVPVDVVFAGGAAIVGAGVHVVDEFAAAANGVADGLLFDVGVEGVVENADVVVAERAAAKLPVLHDSLVVVHIIGAYGVLVFFTTHMVHVFKHQRHKKNGLLKRMLPGRRQRP